MSFIKIFTFGLATIAAIYAYPSIPVLKSSSVDIEYSEDGNAPENLSIINEPRYQLYNTHAHNIKLMSDCDTLNLTLKELESQKFNFITAQGDTTLVEIFRDDANSYEYPSQEMRKKNPNGKFGKDQAIFDISALMHAISQIHPDIYYACPQIKLVTATKAVLDNLPDSVSRIDIYNAAAPLVAMIGDGHTHLSFPYNDLLTEELYRMPVLFYVQQDGTLQCRMSPNDIIPYKSRILSINGHKPEDIINSMLPYESGERKHFRIMRIQTDFPALFQLLYGADSYDIEYIDPVTNQVTTTTIKAMQWGDLCKRWISHETKNQVVSDDYSYTVDSINNVAIMDFRSFTDTEKMSAFADSMFTELREKNIGNLIIDIRNNGGGNSAVGDTLLRYIAPVPFRQFDRVIIKTSNLLNKIEDADDLPGVYLFENTDDVIAPRTEEEKHYNGKIYLLTSNFTFSSAADFSWVFKEIGTGTVIGEETGGMNVCFGDITMYEMPLSGLTCSISYKRFWHFNADENDIHGTLPDIEVPAQDALEKTLQLIKTGK